MAMPDPRSLIDVVAPEVTACSLISDANGLVGHSKVGLRFAPSSSPFAEVQSPTFMELNVGGNLDAAQAHLRVAGAHLIGWISNREVDLYPTSQVALQGVLLPSGDTPLSWRGLEPGWLEISLRTPFMGSVFKTRVPCDQVSLEPTRFAQPEWASPGSSSARRELRPGVLVPVAASRTGDTVLQVDTREFSSGIVLETDSGRSRVALPLGAGWIVGWIPADAVTAKAPALLFPANFGGPVMAMLGPDDGFHPTDCPGAFVTPRACDHPVYIIARVGARERKVGWVEPLREMGTGREHPTFPEYDGYRELELSGVKAGCLWKKSNGPAPSVLDTLDPTLVPTPPKESSYFAELLVRASELTSGCADVKP